MSTTLLPTFTPSNAVHRIQSVSKRGQPALGSASLVSLAMGEPDFDTPEQIRAAASAALDDGATHYAPLVGIAPLREALAAEISSLTGETASAADVLITHGGTGALAAAILAIVSPGDRVVIPDPTYSLYADLVAMAGGAVVHLPLGPDLHWDLDQLADALRGARLFVYCSPGNPTGIVHRRDELETLGALLEGTDTLVISDEAYAALTWTAEPFTSALEVPSLRARTVYCQTFSKSHAMTGWRVGYLWGPPAVVAAATRMAGTLNGPLATASQHAALVALRTGAPDIARMSASYLRRRKLAIDLAASIPSWTVPEPEGAFYLFPKYRSSLPATDVVAALNAGGVSVRPGSEFGPHGEGHIRLSYAASDEAITIAFERMAAVFETLPE